MKTAYTCLHCEDVNGKPGIDCKVRESCFDDASSIEQRQEVLFDIPEVKADTCKEIVEKEAATLVY